MAKRGRPAKRGKHSAPRKTKRSSAKTGAKKAGKKKNKLGVKNSLVNNINARKKKGVARPKKKSKVSKKAYKSMQDNWGKK